MGGFDRMWSGALLVVLLVTSCATPRDEPAPTASADPASNTVCDAFQQVEDGLANLEHLGQEDVYPGSASAEVDSSMLPPEPDELRKTGDALAEVGEGLRYLASHLEGDTSGVLAAFADAYLELAALYDEVDHDVTDLEGLDEEILARMVDLALTVGVGPTEDVQHLAALEDLVAVADVHCPDREFEHIRRAAPGSEVHESTAPEPPAALADHSVRFSDEARARLNAAAESTIALFERSDTDKDVVRQEPEERCPLWDPAAVKVMADSLYDIEIQASEVIQGRAMQGDDPAAGWRFTCGTEVPGDPQAGSSTGLEIQAMPVAGLRTRSESSDSRMVDGHRIWEHSTTSFDRQIHEAFAADIEASLAVLVRGSEPELVRAVLTLVLDDLV